MRSNEHRRRVFEPEGRSRSARCWFAGLHPNRMMPDQVVVSTCEEHRIDTCSSFATRITSLLRKTERLEVSVPGPEISDTFSSFGAAPGNLLAAGSRRGCHPHEGGR